MAAKAKKKAKSPAKKAAKKKAKASSKVTRKAKPAAKSARAMAKPVKAKPAKAKPAKARPAKAKAAPAAPRYHTVTSLLNIEGADGAISFFKEAFGATERTRMPGPDGKIMHAELIIGDSVLMVSDVMQQPATKSSLFLYVPDCDATYAQAVAAGASAKMPLQDMFWGDRFGSLTDPFGNTWAVATHKEDVSPEEMQRRMAEMPPPAPPPDAA
jgi:PhnB protein